MSDRAAFATISYGGGLNLHILLIGTEVKLGQALPADPFVLEESKVTIVFGVTSQP